ncbi:hypothetical protein MJO29_012838 [Puccinia striiformis f. sp. tritici]|nr:hypothetical protein MJO29_012838 [Puccinia striiformis f. sp. tritici]
MAEVDALGDVCLNYQMAAILEVGHSLDEDERMIFRSIYKQAGIGDVADSSSYQSTNNYQTSPSISQSSLDTTFLSKNLKPRRMRSFVAVAISLALLPSSLAAPTHHKRFSCGNQTGTTNISTGNTINCSGSEAPPVVAPPPVPAPTDPTGRANDPFANTFPQGAVPTANFGPGSNFGPGPNFAPGSNIGAVGIPMNNFGFPASTLPTFGPVDPGFGQVDPSIGQINPGFGQGDPNFGQGFGQAGPNFGQPVPNFGQDPSQFSQGGLNYGQGAFDPAPSPGGLSGQDPSQFGQGGLNYGQVAFDPTPSPGGLSGQDPSQFSRGGLNYGQATFDPTPSPGGLGGAPGPYVGGNGF